MSNSVLSCKDLRAAFQRSQVSSPPNSETQFRHARTGNHKLALREPQRNMHGDIMQILMALYHFNRDLDELHNTCCTESIWGTLRQPRSINKNIMMKKQKLGLFGGKSESGKESRDSLLFMKWFKLINNVRHRQTQGPKPAHFYKYNHSGICECWY